MGEWSNIASLSVCVCVCALCLLESHPRAYCIVDYSEWFARWQHRFDTAACSQTVLPGEAEADQAAVAGAEFDVYDC